MVQRVSPHAPALMYHDLVSTEDDERSGFPGRDAALYKVTIARFEEQIRALSELENRESGFVVTFDDGGVSAVEAAHILERYGFAGHFFVTTNYIGTRGFLNADQIRDLHRRGHVIGSHSSSHPLRMGHCSWPQLVDEWTQSRAVLEDTLQCEVRSASVPGGDFSPSVAEAAARAGITLLFTSEPTVGARQTFGVQLRGRFTIQRWTTTETVRGLVVGEWLPRARQAAIWNAKKLTKRVGGARYLRLRRLLIGHGNEVRWGDL